MTDVVVDRLVVRGGDTARMARLAAARLPAALEGVMGDVPDARLDAITVTLGFSPADHDDDTIVALWAAAIHDAVVAHTGRRTSPAARESTPSGRHSEAPDTPAVLEASRDSALRWIAAPTARIPSEALSLLAHAADGISRVGAKPGELADISAQLAAGIDDWLARRRHTTTASPLPYSDSAPPETAAPPRDASPGSTDPPALVRLDENVLAGSGSRDDGGAHASRADHSHPGSDLVARVSALADVSESGDDLDLTLVTEAAGLALLYPWLTDLCRESVTLHPSLDEREVRARALAAVVDPLSPGLVHDPWVRLLAGLDHDIDAAVLPHHDAVCAAADGALRSFAALLPGFAESSPEFVRRSWIARLGLLDVDRDPVLLTAATHPLDVLLPMLPYPIALFRLPWAPPVTVRFRP